MKHNGFEYVDLGLPSGTKWATCNIGADKETDYGLYFDWGDQKGYSGFTDAKKFSWGDYKFSVNGSSDKFTKYNSTDRKAVLDLCDDAAQANMGGKWHMPTIEQFRELKSNTIICWKTNYNDSGVNGILFTSKSDASKNLFLPACGCLLEFFSFSVGEICNYWSSSKYNSINSFGFSFQMNSKLEIFDLDSRSVGKTIRGVFNTFWMK